MATFDTPDPISVSMELGVGDIRIVASDRNDTVVEVRPADGTKKSHVTAAAQTRVEYANGVLVIKAPKGWRPYSYRSGGEAIDVRIELPTGSDLRAGAGVAAVRSSGQLGDCQCKTGVGDIDIDQAESVHLATGMGDIVVGRVAGHAEVTTGSGKVRIGTVDGTTEIKNSNGDTWIGEIVGDLRVKAANGNIVVDHAQAAVAAKTANGDIRLGAVGRGAVLAETALGDVEVGIRNGVAAWLDLNSRFGTVANGLDAAEPPQSGQDSVEVRVRTSCGDITVRRVITADAVTGQV